MAARWRDDQIAASLNRMGLRTGLKGVQNERDLTTPRIARSLALLLPVSDSCRNTWRVGAWPDYLLLRPKREPGPIRRPQGQRLGRTSSHAGSSRPLRSSPSLGRSSPVRLPESLKRRLTTAMERSLPPAITRQVKKLHYYRVVRSFDVETEPDLKAVARLVMPGERVIDVGANIGVYTAFLSRMVGDDGMVCSVEPTPATFDILRSNTRRLRLSNVTTVRCAVSDHEGIVTLEIPRFPWGAENLYQARLIRDGGHDGAEQIRVKARTLDSIADHLGGVVSFIKCDVEGHELQCINGANGLLRRMRPAWLIEVSGDPDRVGSSGNILFSKLGELDYGAFSFDGDRMVAWQPGGRRSVNYFFLTRDHIGRLRNGGLAFT